MSVISNALRLRRLKLGGVEAMLGAMSGQTPPPQLARDERVCRSSEFHEFLRAGANVRKAGEDALYQLGITGIDPKLVNIVGRLKYRTSYGQSVMNHSMEVGYIAGMIAAELNLNSALAKKCGFFHDIGKSVDHETQGSHPEIGHMILKKFNMDEDICQAALTHHHDKPYNIYSSIAKAADAISASRVGARRDSYEHYIARLEDLEKTASGFAGIDKVYAIQAGREVREIGRAHV